MNIQQLRESLKIKWLNYYQQNRSWLVKMRIWGTYNGYRRPYSGFILATLSVLEPKLDEILPFILELNNNPDAIIAALGLNFNPEKQLHLINNINQPVNNSNIGRNNSPNKAPNKVIQDTFPVDKVNSREFVRATTSVPTAITKIENFPIPQRIIPTSESIEEEFKTFSELIPENSYQPISQESMVAPLEYEDEVLSLLNMCNETEETGEELLELASEKESDKIESISRKKASKIASWIDEFCQGAGWDREEAIFIPF